MTSPYSPSVRWSCSAALSPFLTTRGAVLAVTLLAGLLLPARPQSFWYLSPAVPRNPFAVGDSLYYLAIAANGYGEGPVAATRVAFFPLYPLLVATLNGLGAGRLIAALLISHVAFFVALALLAALARRHGGDGAGHRAPLYLAAFPFSFYFSHAYAESLFLMLTLAAFLAADCRRWGICATAAGLAALTRPFGVLMLLPFAVWTLAAWRGRRAAAKAADDAEAGTASGCQAEALSLSGPLIAATGVIAGVGAYSAYCAARTGDPLAWLRAHEGWNYHLGLTPWRGYSVFLEQIDRFGLYASLTSYPYSIYGLLGAVAALAFVACQVPVARRLGAAYVAWSLAMLVVPLGSGSWEGLGRYCAVNFPVFMALSTSESRLVDATMAVAAAVLLGVLAALFAGGHPFT